MSKIFDALKLQAGESLDLTQQVRRMGSLDLFPPPSGAQQDDFDRLANRILSLRTNSRGTVLGFAASASGEGASFVSYNAAVVLAQDYGQRVAWIDGNFLSPQKRLQERGTVTFSALLMDPGTVANLVPDTSPFVVGAGAGLLRNKGLFAASGFREVLDRLAGLFDFVIIDMPPVLNCPDTTLMAAGCDGMLLVIEQKYLKWEIIEHGIQALRDKGVEVLGSVINHREFALPKIIYNRL
jgi:Mrp family chromosome partitioning ATPase